MKATISANEIGRSFATDANERQFGKGCLSQRDPTDSQSIEEWMVVRDTEDNRPHRRRADSDEGGATINRYTIHPRATTHGRNELHIEQGEAWVCLSCEGPYDRLPRLPLCVDKQVARV